MKLNRVIEDLNSNDSSQVIFCKAYINLCTGGSICPTRPPFLPQHWGKIASPVFGPYQILNLNIEQDLEMHSTKSKGQRFTPHLYTGRRSLQANIKFSKINLIWRYFKEIYYWEFTYKKRNDLNLKISYKIVISRSQKKTNCHILSKTLFFSESLKGVVGREANCPMNLRPKRPHSTQIFRVWGPHKVKPAVIFQNYF